MLLKQALNRRNQTTKKVISKKLSTKAPKTVSSPSVEQAKSSVKRLSTQELTLSHAKAKYTLNQNFGGFSQIELNDYLSDDKKSKVSMIDGMLGFMGTHLNGFHLPKKPYKAERVSDYAIKFSRTEDSWLIEHIVEVDPKSGYGSNVTFKWTNLAQESRQLNSSVYVFNKVKVQTQSKGGFLPDFTAKRQTISYDVNSSQEYHDLKKFFENNDGKPLLQESHPIATFVGFDNHYFLSAFIPETKDNQVHHLVINKDREFKGASFDTALFTIKQSIDQGMVAPGASKSFKMKSWNGPKSQKLMTSFSTNLTEAIDLGWFSAIAHVFYKALEFLYKYLGNWGVAIIVFTTIIKILLYPLARSSAVSMHRMKKVQPMLNDIKQRYKDNPQKQQQETMAFMREHKVNPFKGCLPMLPTIPIFIACWRTLQSSVELRQAPFFGWITDLSAADPYFVTPILGGILMLVQQKMTPTTGMDKTQENMMLMMPIMFTFVMLTMPAGVVLYSLTNTIITFLQQQWLNKKLEQSAA